MLKIKFHSEPVYDEKYLKTKVYRKKTCIILALRALLLILL